MRLTFSTTMAAAALLALNACGGGGGGSTTTPDTGTVVPPTVPVPVENIVLTLSPSPVTLQQNAGTATTFSVNIKASKAIPSTVNAAIAARGDLFSNTNLTALSAQEYEARITTSATLPPGTYTSNIEVKLCTDAANTCRSPVSGSPWLLPVTLTVKVVGTLSTLAPVNGLHAWSQDQYDAARTGYIPAAFTPSAFNFRWSVDAEPAKQRRFNSIAIVDKTVYLVSSEAPATGTEPLWTLQTIEEASGQERWHVSLGNRDKVSAPIVTAANLSLLTSVAEANSYRTFNLRTGQQLSQLNVTGAQSASYAPPLLSLNAVYGQYGAPGVLAKLNPANGTVLWQTSVLSRATGGWAVSTDEKLVYNYNQGSMVGIDAITGRLVYNVSNTLPYASETATMAPVLSATQAFVTDYDKTGGALISHDTATGKRNWLVQANFSSYPALVKDVLYAINGGKLEARQASNGASLWTSAALGGSADEQYTQVLATDNLAFAASPSRVVAVDLVTHAVVWQYPAGGKMAISDNGILYLTHPVNGVVAINLK